MGQAMRDVSVIICTYTEKRWPQLKMAVDSVYAQSVQPREIILVVDHNPALLARVHEQWPDAVFAENRGARGLSGTRNSGVALARGALIAFLDDDAMADTTWLEKLTDCFDDQDVLGAGTSVVPLWETDRPRWFPVEFDWVVGCTYRGLPQSLAPIRNPFGGSMCLRREVFAEVGGFRDGIGRVEAHPMGCEETELSIRARQHWPGKEFLYQPQGRVQHWVPASRTNWRYFLARCYAEGQSKALVTRSVGHTAGLASERTYTLRTLPQGVARGLADASFRRDPMGFARAGAIVAGLLTTVTGYGQQWLSQRFATLLHRKDAFPITATDSRAARES